jgi:exodeoxyribonuclease VII large subunit
MDELKESAKRIWSVGALCKAVSDALQSRFNPVAVKGEITGFTRASSGHCYFSIKDTEGQLRCAMFKRAASLLEFAPKDGESVEVFGKLGVYEARGELQLVVESMRRAGLGSLFEQFLKLKAKLEEEGLFEHSRKRRIMTMPRKIGVVTSVNAAALHDVCTALKRRVPHIEVVVSPAIVQGIDAPSSLVQALKQLYLVEAIDVILLVRGGGSIEDLWGFNSEELARTIVQSPVPVICGVGHETDFTIADFCADLRAPTPTAAAEMCAVPRDMLLEGVENLFESLTREAHTLIDRAQQRIDYLQDRLGRPSSRLHQERAKLTHSFNRMKGCVRLPLAHSNNKTQLLGMKLDRGLKDRVLNQRDRLQRSSIRLELLDPSLVLQRGYAWLSNKGDVPITLAAQAHPGDQVKAVLSDGELDLSVAQVRLNSLK